MQKTAIDTLLEAGMLAPSGDNTQPWHFSVDRSKHRIFLDIDPTRDPSPMNAGGRMARMSLGAVLENMVRTAQLNDWSFQIDQQPSLGVASLTLDQDWPAGEIDTLLRQRVTNRRQYQGGVIAASALAGLASAIQDDACTQTVLISDADQCKALVKMIARADPIILGTKAVRNAFLEKVRFDAPPMSEVDEGLSLGSLEISAMDRLSLRAMYNFSPPDRLMQMFGARQIFSRVAGRLAGSAAAFCLITQSVQDSWHDLQVGRAWQRIWLQCAVESLATQPMMSLLVLQNMLEQGMADVFASSDRQTARDLVEEFHLWITKHLGVKGKQPAALMRIGQAAAPSTSVKRLPAEKLTSEI